MSMSRSDDHANVVNFIAHEPLKGVKQKLT